MGNGAQQGKVMAKTADTNSTVALWTARFCLAGGNINGAKYWLGRALALANREGTDKGRILAAISYANRIETEA